MSVESLAEAIIDDIIDEMTGRAGLGGAWESIDEETREGLLDEWQNIVERHIRSLCHQADSGSRIQFPDTTGC